MFAVTNTLAYCCTVLIEGVKRFIVQAQVVDAINLFSPLFLLLQTKLKCFVADNFFYPILIFASKAGLSVTRYLRSLVCVGQTL